MARILVLEDEGFVHRWISSLCAEGHAATHVETAEEALEELIALGTKYDVVVLDLRVPLGYPKGVSVPPDLQDTDAGWFVMHEVRKAEASVNADVWFLVCSAWAEVKTERYKHLAKDKRCVAFHKGDDVQELSDLLALCIADPD